MAWEWDPPPSWLGNEAPLPSWPEREAPPASWPGNEAPPPSWPGNETPPPPIPSFIAWKRGPSSFMAWEWGWVMLDHTVLPVTPAWSAFWVLYVMVTFQEQGLSYTIHTNIPHSHIHTTHSNTHNTFQTHTHTHSPHMHAHYTHTHITQWDKCGGIHCLCTINGWVCNNSAVSKTLLGPLHPRRIHRVRSTYHTSAMYSLGEMMHVSRRCHCWH